MKLRPWAKCFDWPEQRLFENELHFVLEAFYKIYTQWPYLKEAIARSMPNHLLWSMFDKGFQNVMWRTRTASTACILLR